MHTRCIHDAYVQRLMLNCVSVALPKQIRVRMGFLSYSPSTKYAHITTHVLESFGIVLFVSLWIQGTFQIPAQRSDWIIIWNFKCELRQSSNTFNALLCGPNKSRFQTHAKRMQNTKQNTQTDNRTILTQFTKFIGISKSASMQPFINV